LRIAAAEVSFESFVGSFAFVLVFVLAGVDSELLVVLVEVALLPESLEAVEDFLGEVNHSIRTTIRNGYWRT
jgi:hypothetical protein